MECWSQDPDSRPSFEQIATRLRSMNVKSPMINPTVQEVSRVEPPSGVVYLVCTDIDGANELWDTIPMTMLEAISMVFFFCVFPSHSLPSYAQPISSYHNGNQRRIRSRIQR